MNNSRFGMIWRGALVLAILGIFCSLSFATDVERRTLELKLSGSDLIQTSHPFKRVSIADPAIADVVVLSPREIYVYGKKVGYTSVMLWEEGKGRTLLDVVVSLDLTALKQKLHELYPAQEIDVYASETGVVLTGTVSGPEVVEQVIRLTRNYLPKAAEDKTGHQGTGKSGLDITNLLKVGGLQQVMLEIKFAEVNRNSTKNLQAALGLEGLGSDFLGAFGTSGVLTNFTDLVDIPMTGTFPQLGQQALSSISLENNQVISGLVQNPSSLLLNFAENPANIFVNIDNFTAALNFLETEGLARTLAEPRLVTQSGQEASFLAGGEFPIPVDEGTEGITIEFREFGVGLVFTPIVLSDGKISLRVAPSVSRTAETESIPSGITGASFEVPNLVTRKLETTVQLYDGQTLALAGLLQDNIRETVRKIPGLGDIPILGALFRSSSYQQEKTDLLVTVTPRLVKPAKAGEIRYPGEDFQPPTQFEFYLEGRLEGKRPKGEGAAMESPMAKAGGLEGEFGHQPVSVQ